MFQHLTGSTTVREAATLTSGRTTNVRFPVFDTRAGTVYLAIRIQGRTQGGVIVQVQGSYDGGSSYKTLYTHPSLIGADGYTYLTLRAPLPPRLRLALTPTGGFDGRLSAVLRTSGIVSES